MPVRRHDWLKYKQDYFDSDIAEVVNFFATFDPPITKNQFGKRIKGWKEEKQAYKKQQADAARAKIANDPDVKNLTKRLIEGKRNALNIVIDKLSQGKDELGMRDLREGIDIIKRELGEPLTISENKNKNENEFVLGDDFNKLVSGYLKNLK